MANMYSKLWNEIVYPVEGLINGREPNKTVPYRAYEGQNWKVYKIGDINVQSANFNLKDGPSVNELWITINGITIMDYNPNFNTLTPINNYGGINYGIRYDGVEGVISISRPIIGDSTKVFTRDSETDISIEETKLSYGEERFLNAFTESINKEVKKNEIDRNNTIIDKKVSEALNAQNEVKDGEKDTHSEHD